MAGYKQKKVIYKSGKNVENNFLQLPRNQRFKSTLKHLRSLNQSNY